MAEDSRDSRGNAEEAGCDAESSARRPSRDELEKRLAAFALDVRADIEEAEKKRRAATQLEARAFVEGISPPESRGPERVEDVKVVVAAGVDPRHDPTLFGRRNERGDQWDFRADGEIVDAPIAPANEDRAREDGSIEKEPLGTIAPAPQEGRRRKRFFPILFAAPIAIAVCIAAMARLPSESTTSTAAVPTAAEVEPQSPSGREEAVERGNGTGQDRDEESSKAATPPPVAPPRGVASAKVAPVWTSRPSRGPIRRDSRVDSPIGKYRGKE